MSIMYPIDRVVVSVVPIRLTLLGVVHRIVPLWMPSVAKGNVVSCRRERFPLPSLVTVLPSM